MKKWKKAGKGVILHDFWEQALGSVIRGLSHYGSCISKSLWGAEAAKRCRVLFIPAQFHGLAPAGDVQPLLCSPLAWQSLSCLALGQSFLGCTGIISLLPAALCSRPSHQGGCSLILNVIEAPAVIFSRWPCWGVTLWPCSSLCASWGQGGPQKIQQPLDFNFF